jgi:thioredoxin:protein disulfide reductase
MQFRLSTWRYLFRQLCLWLLLSVSSMAAMAKTPLPADQAFMFSTTITSPRLAMVEWRIAPGYYLYSKRVHVSAKPDTGVDIRIPQGDLKYDALQGRLEVFSGSVSVPVSLSANESTLQLNVDYQGCSVEGFCYPPIHKTLSLNFTDKTVSQIEQAKAVASPWHTLATNQNGIRSLFDTTHFGLMLLIFAGLGLLLTFTPCVLPMIPIITGIIVGQKGSVSTKKGLLLSSTYVLGSSLTYAFAGVLAALMGSSLQVWLQQPWVIGIASGLFVLLALSLFGFYELRLPSRLQNRMVTMSNRLRGGNYLGVFFMGMVSALIVSPCVTAPLVGVLMYISQTGDVVLGGSSLFAMGIGMGIPLILIGMSAGKWLPKAGAWMDIVKKGVGLLMIGMAIWLFSRVASTMVTLVLTGFLLFGVATFLGLYLPRLIQWRRLSRGMGMLAGLSGMLVMFGAGAPTTMMNTWMGASQVEAASSFTMLHDMASLNKQLLIAQAAGKPVVLDFYADWCESCVLMDKHVFSMAEVKRALNHYVLLRADLTSNSAEDQLMMQSFKVIAPPTILFFDSHGRELDSERIIGEVTAKEFLTRIDKMSLSQK